MPDKLVLEVQMLQARSIGKRAGEILGRPLIRGQVLASFARICDLLTEEGEVFALGWHDVNPGPFNILLYSQPGAALPAGTRFVVSGDMLVFHGHDTEGAAISLAGAQAWDPQPDWQYLGTRLPQMRERCVLVAQILDEAASPASMGSLRHQWPGRDELFVRPPAEPPVCPPVVLHRHLAVAQRAITALQSAYERDDRAALSAAIEALCGLGPGLTPAGDDWLAGWLLALRLRGGGAKLQGIGAAVMQAAALRTNTLSRAFLECAAAGEADESWHALLSALAKGPDARVTGAARAILTHGATSGADMLAGFLWGLHAPGASAPHGHPHAVRNAITSLSTKEG